MSFCDKCIFLESFKDGKAACRHPLAISKTPKSPFSNNPKEYQSVKELEIEFEGPMGKYSKWPNEYKLESIKKCEGHCPRHLIQSKCNQTP